MKRYLLVLTSIFLLVVLSTAPPFTEAVLDPPIGHVDHGKGIINRGEDFNFKIEIDGVIMAGFKEVSGIESETEIIEIKDGDDMAIGRETEGISDIVEGMGDTVDFKDGDDAPEKIITFKRGFINDPALRKWMDETVEGKTDRKSGSVILEGGDEIRIYDFFDALPVQWKWQTHSKDGKAQDGEGLRFIEELNFSVGSIKLREEPDLIIPAGDNQFRVVDAGFGVQLPADFFGPGSEPFEGTIICGGENDGSVDAIIKRLDDINLPPPPSEDTIPIEMVELNLVSCQPISVTTNDGNQQLWNVRVSLPPNLAPIVPFPSGEMTMGLMTVEMEYKDIGTFDSHLPVQPRFTFTKVGDSQEDTRFIDDPITPLPIGVVIIEDIVIDAFEAFDVPWKACPSPDSEFIWNFCPETESIHIQFFSDDSWLNLELVVPDEKDDSAVCPAGALINPIQYDINGNGAVDGQDANSLQFLVDVSGFMASGIVFPIGLYDEKDTEVDVDDLQSLMDFSRVFFDSEGKPVYSYKYSEGKVTDISVFQYQHDDPATDEDESGLIESVQQYKVKSEPDELTGVVVLKSADINSDGLVDEKDTELLKSALKSLVDIDGDGVSDERDVSALQSLLASQQVAVTSGDMQRADVNSDGVIDEKDTEAFALALKSLADINGDGICDGLDNDCDRAIDEDYGRTEPGEVCDGADNDCDGVNTYPADSRNDADNDGVCDAIDNCQPMPNPDQSDSDADGIGDACDNCPNDPDNDADADGICGDVDSCSLENPQGLDANSDGCIDTTEGLYEHLQSIEIQTGVKNSLLEKVSNALSSLTTGRTNAAINQLGAFINQIEAQSGKKLSWEDTIVLASFAQNIGWVIALPTDPTIDPTPPGVKKGPVCIPPMWDKDNPPVLTDLYLCQSKCRINYMNTPDNPDYHRTKTFLDCMDDCYRRFGPSCEPEPDATPDSRR